MVDEGAGMRAERGEVGGRGEVGWEGDAREEGVGERSAFFLELEELLLNILPKILRGVVRDGGWCAGVEEPGRGEWGYGCCGCEYPCANCCCCCW